MIFINEWFPNPAGSDAKGEFIELFNNGNAPVNLENWKLETSAGKKAFSLNGYSVAANSYLVLKRSQTKLTLKNSDESLSLYNSNGHLVDQSSFLGEAPEGKSFSRINDGTDPSQHFAFSMPTPGGVNRIALDNGISVTSYPFDVPLNRPSPVGAEIFGMMIGVGAIFTSLVIYSLKHDETISKLFFGRDDPAW